jgi:tRNA modification GTPase
LALLNIFAFSEIIAVIILQEDRNMEKTETIAAIATAMTPAGISVIRVSGPEALMVTDRVFQAAKPGKKLVDQKGYTAHYGHIVDRGEVLDEVLVLVMRAPHSYTTEDTAEISCHGGILVTRRVLDAVLRNGARLAGPGEFTKRAFLGGRIDIAQAEAVMDLIESKNDLAMKNSIRQLSGKLSEKVKKWRKTLIFNCALIESAVDDPEHYSLDGYREKLSETLTGMIGELKHTEDSFDGGRVICDGIDTVILGKPNVGKSSLMNVLVGDERAIVTDIAGTTRDTLEEQVRLKGISLNIIDTAGIRDTDNPVEKIGVARAKKVMDRADLILYIIDASRPMDENDREIIRLIRGRKSIVLLNKTDLKNIVSAEEAERAVGQEVLPISAKEQTGIDALENKIESMFLTGKIEENDDVFLTNAWHREAVRNARQSLELVMQSIRDGMPEDLYTGDLMDAYESLGLIIGETLEDDLADEIFSRFCMGK